MSEFKYEVGDKFQALRMGVRVVRGRVSSNSGLKQYWVIDELGEASTYLEYQLDNWTKIEPFFEEGKIYESEFGTRYGVTHVDSDRRAAWAVRLSDERRVNLHGADWGVCEEVTD